MGKTQKTNNKKNLLPFFLVLSDCLAIFLAVTLAYVLRNKGFFRIFLDSIQPIHVYLAALPFAILLLLVLFALADLYEPKRRITTFSENYTAIKTITLWILLIMAGSYLTKFDYSRIIVMLLYFFTIILVIFGRLVVRRAQITAPNTIGVTRIAVVGTGKAAHEITKRIEAYKYAGLSFEGFIGKGKNAKLLGPLASLYTLLRKYNIHEVYIVDPKLSEEKILTLIAKCPDKKVRFKVVSNIFELITGNINIADLESIPSLDLHKIHFPWWKKTYKRILDIIIAAFILTITLPLWIVIMITISLDSRGTLFIAQKRIGLYGSPFSMYKFRTMEARTPLFQKSPEHKNDERITRVGKILRRTSLDELPQLLNVIKGDMSLVGPRPEMPFVVRKYSAWEKRRLLVKPGITGLWQILGRKDLPLAENLEYDFYYINNQSLILDITILLKTIPVVLFGKGAY